MTTFANEISENGIQRHMGSYHRAPLLWELGSWDVVSEYYASLLEKRDLGSSAFGNELEKLYLEEVAVTYEIELLEEIVLIVNTKELNKKKQRLQKAPIVILCRTLDDVERRRKQRSGSSVDIQHAGLLEKIHNILDPPFQRGCIMSADFCNLLTFVSARDRFIDDKKKQIIELHQKLDDIIKEKTELTMINDTRKTKNRREFEAVCAAAVYFSTIGIEIEDVEEIKARQQVARSMVEMAPVKMIYKDGLYVELDDHSPMSNKTSSVANWFYKIGDMLSDSGSENGEDKNRDDSEEFYDNYILDSSDDEEESKDNIPQHFNTDEPPIESCAIPRTEVQNIPNLDAPENFLGKAEGVLPPDYLEQDFLPLDGGYRRFGELIKVPYDIQDAIDVKGMLRVRYQL